MEKIFVLLLCLFVLLYPSEVANAQLIDIAGHTYEKAIQELYNSKTVQGNPDGTYKPDATINRAEFTILVLRTLKNEGTTAYCFPDVQNEWFAMSVCQAKAKGIIGGYSDGYFRPGHSINVAEAAKILVESFGFLYSTKGSNEQWYTPYIEVLANKKALPTTIGGSNALLTRGEMAQMLWILGTGRTDQPSLTLEQASTPISPIETCKNSMEECSIAPIVSNVEFESIIQSGKPMFVLDARESTENSYGNFPGSTHIRYADLLYATGWEQLPTNQEIYVICWSAIRGQEVATFLRSKGIIARYLEKGAVDWVDNGGLWNGEIRFANVYPQPQYSRVLSLQDVELKLQGNAIMVDSRHPDKFPIWHIPGSVSIPMIHTPSGEIDTALAQVPSGKQVITLCDDFVSCFDAKLTGLALEQKGHVFLGRFTAPWEYRKAHP